MLTGSDLRRYRKLLGLNQTDFSVTLGLAQSTLSHIEGGRISLSPEHVTILTQKFTDPPFKPSFQEFAGETERSKAEGPVAAQKLGAGHVLLPAWRWEEGFDLNRVPPAGEAADLILVRPGNEGMIALQMPRRSSCWAERETIVFGRCTSGDIVEGDLCLVQVRTARSRTLRTIIALAHQAPGKRGQSLHLEPVSPAGPPSLVLDESVLVVFRAVYRGRYLH